jgi:hypothetical protein
MQQSIDALQHRQLDLQEREQERQLAVQQADIELRRDQLAQEYDFKREQLVVESELRRLAIERADDNEKATQNRLVDSDKARLEMARRGQTAAILLAFPILLGSFLFGVALVLLTVVGVVGATLGGTLGGLFVGGPLLASTAKVIQSFTGGTPSDDSQTDSASES